jgi:hypothetical protein
MFCFEINIRKIGVRLWLENWRIRQVARFLSCKTLEIGVVFVFFSFLDGHGSLVMWHKRFFVGRRGLLDVISSLR